MTPSTTILITLGDSFVARNLFSTHFLAELTRKRSDARIVVVVKKGTATQYAPLFAEFPNVSVRELAVTTPVGKERFIARLARTCFRSGTLRVMQHRAELAHESRTPTWFKGFIMYLVGDIRMLRSAVRGMDAGLPDTAAITELLNDVKPNVVFSTLLLEDELDIPLLRAAKRRGIATVGMVRGWDNLTSYGFMRQLPDTFIAQNAFIKDMATRFHDMPEDRIVVTGFPHYDHYLDSSLYESRDTFLTARAVPVDARVVLYAAVGDFLLPGERRYMDIFESLAERAPGTPLHFIYRGHPVLENGEQEKLYAHVSFNAPRRYHGGEARVYRVDDIRADFSEIINLIRHAEVVMTPGSTFLLDSAAFEKEPIAIGFDPAPTSYWLSCARFFDSFGHLVAALATGIPLARTKEELALLLRTRPTQGLGALRERFIEPQDGKAAARVAEAVLKAT